jgi:hypothetical protein
MPGALPPKHVRSLRMTVRAGAVRERAAVTRWVAQGGTRGRDKELNLQT